MSSQKSKWLLPLPDFKPTNINYSVSDDHGCLICRDYSEIDNFAKAVTLQKLQPLCDEAAKGGSSANTTYDPKFFNAIDLLNALKEVKMPLTKWKNPKNTTEERDLLDLLKAGKVYQQEPNQTLRVLFSQYASYPYKNMDQVLTAIGPIKNAITFLREEMERVQKLPGSAASFLTGIERLQNTIDWTWDLFAWLESEGRPKQVRLVAEALWSQFVEAKKTAGYKHQIGEHADHVAKARLIYTWLALSIEYDYDLANNPVHFDRLKGARPVADILATGKEVCRGYAEMFVEMFRAMCNLEDPGNVLQPRTLAHVISGRSRSQGGSVPYDWNDVTESGHAWCAFSTPTSMKVIDPTWGRGVNASKGVVESLWFCMSNASLALSHTPWDGKNFYRVDPNQTKPEDVWKTDQPLFPGEGQPELIWIDASTILPMTSADLTLADGQKTISVSFRNNCEHQGAKQRAGPGFRLGFQPEEQKNADDFMRKKFNATEAVKFETTQKASDSNTVPWLWKAEVEIPRKTSGWLAVYSVLGGFAGIGQTSRRVVLWWVQGISSKSKL